MRDEGVIYEEDGSHLELFDPTQGRFTQLDVATAFGAHPALLADGRVLLVGGREGGAVFDPVTERFSALPAMSRPRHQPAVALLPDGTVLVVGGLDDGSGLDSTTSQSAEIYLAHDPTHPPIPPIREQPVLMVGLDVDFETRSPPDGFEITVPPGGFEGLSTGRVAWSGGSLQHHVFVAESDLSRIDLEIPACEDGCVIAGPLELSPRQFYMAGRSMYVVLELEYADRIPTEAGELTLTVTGGDGG